MTRARRAGKGAGRRRAQTKPLWLHQSSSFVPVVLGVWIWAHVVPFRGLYLYRHWGLGHAYNLEIQAPWNTALLACPIPRPELWVTDFHISTPDILFSLCTPSEFLSLSLWLLSFKSYPFHFNFRQMRIKTTMRYPLHPVERLPQRRQTVTSVCDGVEKLEPCARIVEEHRRVAAMERAWQVQRRLTTELPCDPANPQPKHISERNKNIHPHENLLCKYLQQHHVH